MVKEFILSSSADSNMKRKQIPVQYRKSRQFQIPLFPSSFLNIKLSNLFEISGKYLLLKSCFLSFFLNWNTVDLQFCLSFRYTAKWISYIYTYTNIHTHTHTQTQTHIYIYIHTHIYIFLDLYGKRILFRIGQHRILSRPSCAVSPY